MRHKKEGYFANVSQSPEPITFEIKRRVSFSEVDVMGIVWYGRYSSFFEEAQAELGRRCGLSYQDYYKANLRAPIVEFHIDYYQPLYLDEEFTVRASMVWSEGAKLQMEYLLLKLDGSVATRGYTVQLFIDSKSSQPYIVAPELLERLRLRWQKGELKCPK
ncbi:MAG: acyl-CoA thioesterase [Candidatus Omnitrophica bacterium]|nr:acyl-CoA thioesterase [Candidatus Omnitrophota bacterium]